ncbi:MAG: hypothetical protein JJU27_17475 [Gammaproteobacteria bacterium]|nr:hypothetical protein [Gammaproteobacteria bacterium]
MGQTFQREQIAALFGVEFNPGNWYSGHVVLPSRRAHVLLVTLNKQGKAARFVYRVKARYLRHEGSGPMSVVLGVGE